MGVRNKPDSAAEFEKALAPEVYQAAWRYACWLSSTREDAEDLLQESLARAYRCFHQLRDRQQFRGWLFRIIRTSFLMHKRSQLSASRMLDGHEAMVMDLSTTEHAGPLSTQLAGALLQLPPAQRELISLFYFEEFNLKETARILGITPNAVTQRLHRARAMLRDLLKEQCRLSKASFPLRGDL